ncbi:MAG: hypothetical protein PF692_14090 [Kiritimatiellae bacterium]|jgi:hypothetical protein|nr:hypothetical protein [Kiritimatiellia bacterium]
MKRNILLILIMLSTLVYGEKVSIEQAQRAATDKIDNFYQGTWLYSTNLTYYSDDHDVVAYGFVFTNNLSKTLDDKYRTTTSATFETYTDSEQPIIMSVYRGIPDVMLWTSNIPNGMTFEKYVMSTPQNTYVAVSSNSVSYYMQNKTLKKVEIKDVKQSDINNLKKVLTTEKYRAMARNAWKKYEKQ